MVFHTNIRSVTPPKIIINQQEIQYVDSFNHLGIVLNRHLNWNEHTNMLSKEISQISGILNKHFYLNQLSNIIQLSCVISSQLWHTTLGMQDSQVGKTTKKLIRIINCAKYNAHTEPPFKKMNFCYKFENK